MRLLSCYSYRQTLRVFPKRDDCLAPIGPFSGARSCQGKVGITSRAVVAQLVERVLGKDEVTGSIPVNGSRILIGVA